MRVLRKMEQEEKERERKRGRRERGRDEPRGSGEEGATDASRRIVPRWLLMERHADDGTRGEHVRRLTSPARRRRSAGHMRDPRGGSIRAQYGY